YVTSATNSHSRKAASLSRSRKARQNSFARPLRVWWKKVLTCKPPTEKASLAFLDFLRPIRNTCKKQRALFAILSRILTSGGKIRKTSRPARKSGPGSAQERLLPVHYKKAGALCSSRAASLLT